MPVLPVLPVQVSLRGARQQDENRGTDMTSYEEKHHEEAFIGKSFEPREFEISSNNVDDYFEGLKVDNSWYKNDSPYKAPILPSMVIIEAESMQGAGFRNNFGNLWMRQQLDFHGPLPQDTEMIVKSKVVDIYDWRNRTVVLQEFEIFNSDNKLVGATRHHQSYLLGQTSGRVALRKPSDKEGVRKFNVPKGEEIDSVNSVIDLEMCGTFFHGNKNYHTDKRASEELGFEEVVVGGKMTISYLGDMLDRNFGDRWYEWGSLDVKFTNITWPGDKVTARGVITENLAPDGTGRFEVNVWMEKEDGTVTIVGNAYVPQAAGWK